MLEPMPCWPRPDLCSGLKRKWTRVLWLNDEVIRMSPPWPPSPPEGPPRGTNFSRRKAMQPFPPSPAFTRIFASSMNIFISSLQGPAINYAYRVQIGHLYRCAPRSLYRQQDLERDDIGGKASDIMIRTVDYPAVPFR